MKEYTIKISQNGWESTGYITLFADTIELDKRNDCIAIVTRGTDTFTLTFDEPICL